MKNEFEMRLDWDKKPHPGICIHCGRNNLREHEGHICDDCYSQYTPRMLADLEE